MAPLALASLHWQALGANWANFGGSTDDPTPNFRPVTGAGTWANSAVCWIHPAFPATLPSHAIHTTFSTAIRAAFAAAFRAASGGIIPPTCLKNG